MKRFLAMLVAMIMALSLVTIPVVADQPVVFTAGSVSAAPGELVRIPVSVSGEFEAHTLNMQVNYDQNALTVESVEYGDFLTTAQELGAMIIVDTTTIPGSIRIGSIYPTTGATEGGVIVYVNFRVGEAVTEDQNIDLAVTGFDYLPVGQTTADPIENTTVSGIITIEESEPTEVPTEEPTDVPPMDAARFFVDTYNANVGDEIIVPVVLYNYEGNAHILNMEVNYNADALAVTGVDSGDFLTSVQNAMAVVDYTTIPGSVRIGLACAVDPVPAGEEPITIVNVHFTVLEGAANATNPIELVVSEFMNFPVAGEAVSIENTVTNGAVIVGGSTPVTENPTEVPTDVPTEVPTEVPTPVIPDMATFFAGTYNANVGDEIVVPVVLYNYEGNAHVLNMQVNYDANALAVTGVDNGALLTGAQSAMVIVDYTTIPGSVRVGLACAIDPAPAGDDPITVVSIHFTVLEGANNATNPIELVVAEFKNFPIGGDAVSIENTVINGAVIVGDPVPSTETPVPTTETPAPPTDTPVPPTDTPVPPTDTPVPPTDTPVPPTDTPVPPTETPVPPTDTPNPDDIVFSAPTVYGRPGDLVAIPVSVEGEFNVHSIQIRLLYDPELVTFESVETADIFGGAIVVCQNKIDDQGASVRFGVASPMDAISVQGVYFTVMFRVNSDVNMGTDIPLTFDREHFEFTYMPLDGETYDYPVFFNDGAIIVGEEPIETPKPTDEPITDEPTTDEPITDEPVTNEPTTDEPVTGEPATDEPIDETPVPTDTPNPPVTGTIALVGVGIAAIAAGAGVVLFRKKEDEE